MNYKKNKKNKGFVLLFATTLSSILLAIALGVANIALKEIKFGTSAKDTNDAFLAADTGIECALYHDKQAPESNFFTGTAGSNLICSGATIPLSGASPSWSFIVPGLGSTNQACAKVTVTKDITAGTTSIISKGYNNGSPACNPGSNTVERQLESNY